MIQVLGSAWALLLGVLMLMVGNGVQGTLLGVRGEIEDFSTFQMSIVMSGYFIGFLGGSRMAPEMIRRVGHVRVFAALGSMISAVLILFPILSDPVSWTIGRILVGFCFSGVYVTAESWLNNSATNENRGKALSLYMIVQMAGIVFAQFLLLLGDPSGYELFIIPSVLVSLAFAPILLSISPTPAFDSTKPMRLRELLSTSPLASVGMILLGGVFAAQFGMAAVYATQIGLSVAELSIFVSTIYLSALIAQYPIGWVSDRMDRRLLIVILAVLGGAGAVMGAVFQMNFSILLISGALIGGTSNPLYSLLIAYANDFLEHEDMASASAGFVFVNGLGAVAGPIVIGWVMEAFGAEGFWIVIAILMFALGAYGTYRMSQRAAADPADTISYTPVPISASPVAVEFAQEVYIETELEDNQESE